MKILAVISSLRLATGGPAIALRETVAEIAAVGVHSTIACCEMESKDSLPSTWPDGVAAENLGGLGLRNLVQRPPARLRALVAGSDLIHLHGLWDPILVLAARAARLEGKPIVCTPHGMLSPWSLSHHRLRKVPYFRLFVGPALRRAAAIHFVTESESELAARNLPAGPRRFVTPIFPERCFFDEPPDRDAAVMYFPAIPTDGPWVLFLSRIHPGKGLPEVIAAFPEVLAKFPPAQLIIAGSGAPAYEGEMRNLAERAGIAGSTHFVGLVRGEAKRALYRRATVLAVPSSHENFGMVFVESLACGTPVLITPETGVFKEIMRAGGGIEVKQEKAAVAAALCRALGDPDRLRAAGEAGREWVLGHLQPSRIAAQMAENYRRAIASAGGRHGP